MDNHKNERIPVAITWNIDAQYYVLYNTFNRTIDESDIYEVIHNKIFNWYGNNFVVAYPVEIMMTLDEINEYRERLFDQQEKYPITSVVDPEEFLSWTDEDYVQWKLTHG